MFQASEEAVRALESVQDDTVVHVSNVNTDDEQEADYPVLLERDLFVCIQNGDLKNVVYCLEKYSKWINTVYIHRSMDVKMKVLELVFRAEAIERENKECITYVGQGKCLSQIMKINNSEQLFLWLEERILKVCKSLYKNEKRNHDVVKMAREFIEMNYAKDIDLEEISSYLQISPYYFSKLFKKKTGKNFIEYLTQIRLEHAKLLLTNSCKSMKEICMEVGYGDANYFSRIFKKNVGISPTEYKMEKCGV
jgi:two-component system response regulator YesN